MVFGAIFTVAVRDRAQARALYAALFRHGVLAHSICETEPPTLKFFPPILMTAAEADLVAAALDRAAREVAR
jgi:acetylornithine aminotransferase